MELNRVSKKAILNMFITAAIWVLILLVVALVLWFGVVTEETSPNIYITILSWGLFALFEIAILITPFIRWRRYRYVIDENRIVKSEGLIFITTEIAPIERVHQISVMRGPIDRLTGLSKVMATTAGGEIVIRFLEHKVAEELALRLEAKIKQITKRQGESNAR